MREILFRGKRIDNGEWVEGYPFNIWESAYILWGTTNGVPNMIEVAPETIGQFTGLTDKNGRKIFEGDICKFYSRGGNYVGKVVFNPRTICYELWSNVVVGAYGEKATWQFLLGASSQIECIGTTYDSPELLEAKS